MKQMNKFKKQFVKLRALSKKINQEAKYKDKARLLNRGIGATARIDGYFKKSMLTSAKFMPTLSSRKGRSSTP
jgi:hypothetical protein